MDFGSSLTKQSYKSIPYRILLALLWTQYTILNLVSAVIERLPVIGVLSDLFVPACIIFAILASLPWFAKYIRGRDIMFYIGMVMLVLFTMIFYPRTTEYLQSDWWKILIMAAPFYLVGVSFSDKICSKDLFWCSVLGVISIFAYRIYLIGAGKAPENDDMDAAYKLLPSVMYLIYYAYNKRRKKYWAIAFASSLFMFVFGTRGPILCILIYVIALMMYGVMKERSVMKMIALTAIIILVVAVFSQEELFLNLSMKLSNLLERHGFSSRIFDYYLAGEAATSKGRELLADQAIEAISLKPVFGYGFTGDRYLLGIYVHNFILEIWLHFGIVFGSIILVSIIGAIIFSLVKTVKSRRTFTFVLMLVCMIFVKLLLSSTYTIEPYFYFMIGVLVCTIRKGTRSGGVFDEKRN